MVSRKNISCRVRLWMKIFWLIISSGSQDSQWCRCCYCVCLGCWVRLWWVRVRLSRVLFYFVSIEVWVVFCMFQLRLWMNQSIRVMLFRLVVNRIVNGVCVFCVLRNQLISVQLVRVVGRLSRWVWKKVWVLLVSFVEGCISCRVQLFRGRVSVLSSRVRSSVMFRFWVRIRCSVLLLLWLVVWVVKLVVFMCRKLSMLIIRVYRLLFMVIVLSWQVCGRWLIIVLFIRCIRGMEMFDRIIGLVSVQILWWVGVWC